MKLAGLGSTDVTKGMQAGKQHPEEDRSVISSRSEPRPVRTVPHLLPPPTGNPSSTSTAHRSARVEMESNSLYSSVSGFFCSALSL